MWDDDRAFETTRNVVIVIFLKPTLEDCIGDHVTAHDVALKLDPKLSMWNAEWCKPNWMTAEFSALYRLHSLIRNAFH